MDIVLGIDRKIEIHHLRNAIDVDAPRDDVRGHHHLHITVLEILQRLESLFLRAAGVQPGHLHAGELEEIRQQVRTILQPHENQHTLEIRLPQQLQQHDIL